MAEMLLQSHDGQIALLPALPATWATGEVRGLRARGGIEVDIAWKDGAPSRAKLHALRDGEHKLRAPSGYRVASVKTSAGKSIPLREGNTSERVELLSLEAGTTYILEFVKI